MRSSTDREMTSASPPLTPPVTVSPPLTATVQAVNTIPADVTIGPVSYDVHFGKRITDHLDHNYLIEVRYNDGRILTEDNQSERWISHVQVARDRHEQNIEISRNQQDGQLFYRTVKIIQPSSKLCIWYSDQLAREIGIPVLTPRQIKGDQTYICDRCFKSFQYPNCLKSHMRYQCNNMMSSAATFSIGSRQSPHDMTSRPIGSRLSPHEMMTSRPIIGSRLSPHEMMTSRPIVGSRLSPHEMMTSRPIVGSRALQIGVNSAFVPPIPRVSSHTPPRVSPIKSPSPTNPVEDPKLSSKDCQPIQIFNHIHPPALIPMDYTALKYYYHPFYQSFAAASRLCCPAPQTCSVSGHCSHPIPHPYLFPFTPTSNNEATRMTSPVYEGSTSKNEESQSSRFKFPLPSDKAGEPLDLIPRSMYISKSRKGHLCIYCGKLYSRKYGLKIHLRTHTGYKPLKCKVCLRPFGDPSNLNKHIRLHAEGETPYRCDHCGKVLVRRRDLERHIKSRHPNEVDNNNRIKQFQDSELTSEIKVENITETTSDELEDDEIIDVAND